MACKAKIRPFWPLNDTELRCGRAPGLIPHTQHSATLRDYAYKGSETVVSWDEGDRRCFKGTFAPCPVSGCTLPDKHQRQCAF